MICPEQRSNEQFIKKNDSVRHICGSILPHGHHAGTVATWRALGERAAVTSLTSGVVIVVVIAHRLGIIVVRALVADRVNGRLTVVHRLQAHTPITGHVTHMHISQSLL